MSDNPPAFPNTGNSTWNLQPEVGMDLRDWFAGQALVALAGTKAPGVEAGRIALAISKACYGIADAMLAERSKS